MTQCAVCNDKATCSIDNYGRMFDVCDACSLEHTKEQVENEMAMLDEIEKGDEHGCEYCDSKDDTVTMRLYDKYPCGVEVLFLCNGCNEDQRGQGFDRAASMRPSYEYQQQRGQGR